MLKVDPSQSLVIELYNPALAVNIIMSGVFRRGEELTYMSRTIVVPPYAAGPTQVIIPLYYDEIISLSCWKPVSPAGHFSCFAHAYIMQGPAINNVRINSLFSGWISDGNPIAYPNIDRVDDSDVLASQIARAPVILPAPDMTLLPVLGMPFSIIGFSGTFTCSANIGNRNIGLGVDDGGGGLLLMNYNPTNFPALQVVTVYGSNKYAQPQTFGNIITIPLPDIIIANPRRFVANVIGVLALDSWTNCIAIIRPYVDR